MRIIPAASRDMAQEAAVEIITKKLKRGYSLRHLHDPDRLMTNGT
jgi:hypothetical protein